MIIEMSMIDVCLSIDAVYREADLTRLINASNVHIV